MKLTLNLTALVMFSFLFFSCSDPITTNNPGLYTSFDYSVQNVALDSISGLSAGDDQTLFFTGNGKAWKMENGLLSQINFDNPHFRIFGGVQALSKDYVLFSGLNTFTFKMEYVIYENGIMRSYTPPYNISVGSATLIARDQFILGGSSNKKYSIFKDNVFTEYSLPDSAQMGWIAVVNNETYMFAVNTRTFNSYYVYKITSTGPVKLREEPSDGIFHIMTNTAIKVVESGTNHIYYNLSGGNWENLFSYGTYDHTKYTYHIGGPSKDFFLELSVQSNNTGGFYYVPRLWNGTGLFTQNNFPIAEFPANTHVPTLLSEYRNNTFYLYRSNEVSGGNLLKVKYKGE